jgi:ribonucleoside-diphosphate reductase alpha subunit
MPIFVQNIKDEVEKILSNNKLPTFWKGLDYDLITKNAISRVPDEITLSSLEDLLAGICASLSNLHPDYSILGARILVSKLHYELDVKNVSFVQNLKRQFDEIQHGRKSTRISKEMMDFCIKNEKELQEIINYDLDYDDYDFGAIQSYLRKSLRKVNKIVAETPNQLFLRVAVGTLTEKNRSKAELDAFENYSGFRPDSYRIMKLSNQEKLDEIKEYYNQLAARKISPQSPIIVHAGSELNQMPSCYLQYCSDSMTGSSYLEDTYNYTGVVGGIFGALTQLAAQGKSGGATGINISDIRSRGSYISKTGGTSNGILPFMKIFDSAISAIDQGGRRAGVCTLYLEPWHKDIFDFLDAADHFTTDEKRCKNIFYALYTNDLFFTRLIEDRENAKWTLFDPVDVKTRLGHSFSDVYGKQFEEQYLMLEKEGLGTTVSLMEIWSRICKLLQISGNPYIVHKDSINEKTNQKNIGTIKGSNVCCEITLTSNDNETGVCVLSSVALPKYVNIEARSFDFESLIKSVKVATRSLNNVIDIQHYPTPQTRNSCLRSRAIGIGAQGLADVFAMLKYDFDSKEAKKLNKAIYEVIYFACLEESCELAKIEGPYNYYKGSPISGGILQHDMWGVKDEDTFLGAEKWKELREKINKYGVRNSEVTALMPTASSSIRMGNTEMHEPFTRNIYIRQYIGGSVQIINPHLVKDLIALDLWSENLCNQIITNEGSVQGIAKIPKDIQSRYRTAYELNFKDLIDMMADRSAFVSQAGSYNHHINYVDSSPTAFTQRIIYAWKKGLKTLSYYIHTEAATTGKKELGGISSKPNPLNKISPTDTTLADDEEIIDGVVCKMEEGCEVCAS